MSRRPNLDDTPNSKYGYGIELFDEVPEVMSPNYILQNSDNYNGNVDKYLTYSQSASGTNTRNKRKNTNEQYQYDDEVNQGQVDALEYEVEEDDMQVNMNILIDKKALELDFLEKLLESANDSLNLIKGLTYELEKVNEGYHSVGNILYRWDRVFRFANIASKNDAEKDGCKMLIKFPVEED